MKKVIDGGGRSGLFSSIYLTRRFEYSLSFKYFEFLSFSNLIHCFYCLGSACTSQHPCNAR